MGNELWEVYTLTKYLERKKLVSFLLLSVVFSIIFVMSSTNANAYSLNGRKLPSKNFAYKWGDNLSESSSVIADAFRTATGDWYSAVNIDLFYSTLAKSTLNSYHVSSSSEYGYTSTSYNSSTGIVNYYHAYVNGSNSNITKNNVARSVAVHELGHPMGLADIQSGTAVMNQQRNRENIYTPQTDDTNGISAVGY